MAATVFTLTKLGQRNLGGGALVVWGSIAADTGDYATGGIAPTPTFASLDFISNRQPDIVLFDDTDGYKWQYDKTNEKLQLFALNLDGNALVNGAFTEHTEAAVAAGVGADTRFLAIWLPKVP